MEEFIPIEIEFLAKADSLPREYREYFLPPLDDGLRLPAANRKVRDMEIQIFGSYIHIRICDHTESRVARAAEAVNYIRDVLTDQVVFCFTDGGVEHYQADEFNSLSETDWNYFLWSGPWRSSWFPPPTPGHHPRFRG